MNPDATRRWLMPRLSSTPPDLAQDILRLLDSVPRSELEDPPEALALAAIAGLEEVARGPGRRIEALRLLAADAALTYAFEAAAEAGTASTLAERIGLRGELGRRLAQAAEPTEEGADR